jgi:hypothetical protein
MVPPRPIRVEDVFDETGFHFIPFQVEECEQNPHLFAAHFATHERFKTELEALFCDKIDTDQTFIHAFCYLATGMAHHLPYMMDGVADSRITVEFNYTEQGVWGDSLLRFHTCTKEVLLPINAYAANMENFQQKVNQVMEMDDF